MALDIIGGAWVILVLTALAGGLLWVIRSVKDWIEVLTIVMILGVLAGLLMPAVQSAREAARRTQAMNDLRAIGLAAGAKAGGEDAAADPVRVRQNFPETLLWRPELITDDQGRATSTRPGRLDHHLAALGQRRLGRGKLGGAESPIRVFQPFFVDLNLPVALTRGDEVAVPAVVYNYLDKPLTVSLVLARTRPWFERLDTAEQNAGAGRRAKCDRWAISASAAEKVGRHEFLAHAAGGRWSADAIKRTIEVVPDGRRVEQCQRHAPAAGRNRLARARRCHRGEREGERQALPLDLQPACRGAGGDLPAALRLLRADLLDDLSQRAGAGLPAPHQEERAPGRGQGPAVHPPGLPAAAELRGRRRRLRLVRPPAGQSHADGLRTDGVQRHGPGARR